jgi:molybdate transport system ATP-binding protein
LLPLITLAHANVHLDGRHVLHDISWRLEAGESWTFLGKNGSGKSTLLRVIRGDQWIDSDGGERHYALDGANPCSVATAAPQIGYVAPEQQERYVRLDLPMRGRAVIESGLDDSIYVQRELDPAQTARVDAIVERFRLHDIVVQPVRALSFGQLRKLLIARALVRDPRILVLDECTNGLDRHSRDELLALLDTIAASIPLVVASHRPDERIAAITHTATLREGRIVEVTHGPPAARTQRRVREAAAAATASHDGNDPLIDIRNADVFREHRRVLRDITWSLRRGEHTALHGANGSGKSTFAGLVAGTIPAATGAEIVRFGKRGPFDLWTLKARIAHVSDELQIAYDMNDSVEAVILSGFASSIGLFHDPDAAQLRAMDAVVRRLGLEPLRRRRFMRLSFGERRKVLIARSLVRTPDLLILDEVWNGLDAEFQSELESLVTELSANGTTLLVIAHHDHDLPNFIARRFTLEDGTLRRR